MNAPTVPCRWARLTGTYSHADTTLRLSEPFDGAAVGKWVSVPRTLEIIEIAQIKDGGMTLDVKRRVAAVVERMVDGRMRLFAVPWTRPPEGLMSDALLDGDWVLLDPCPEKGKA